MALRFYLNNTEIKVQTNTSYTFTQDKSLDAGTLELEWNTNKHAIFPGTVLKIVSESTNETVVFLVLRDEVEIVSKLNPVKYLHKLLVTQNTHALSKYLIRNTNFTQNIRDSQYAYFNGTGAAFVQTINPGNTGENLNFFLDPYIFFAIDGYTENEFMVKRLQITQRQKVSSAKISIDMTATPYRMVKKEYEHYVPSTPVTNKKNVYQEFQVLLKRFSSESSSTPSAVNAFNIKPSDNGSIDIPLTYFDQSGWYQVELNLDNDTGYRIKLDSTEFDYYDILYYDYDTDDPFNDGIIAPSVLIKVRLRLDVETYTYSLYDVLDILQKQSCKTVDGTATRTIFTIPAWNSNFGQELSAIVAPEFNFNGKDLFACISEVFDYIDALPTLDENNELGFEYLNKYSDTLETLDTTDKSTVYSDEYYRNNISSMYQNGKQPTAETYPSKNSFRFTDTKTYNVVSINDYVFTTPHAIESIKKFCLKLPYRLENRLEFTVNRGVDIEIDVIDYLYDTQYLDITEAIFEESLYSLLEEGLANSTTIVKDNALYYSKGSREISCGGQVQIGGTTYIKLRWVIESIYNKLFKYDTAFHFTLLNINTIFSTYTLNEFKYRIEYYGSYNGRIDIPSPTEKTDGECYANQLNSGVALNRMGRNMFGLISMLGNEQTNVTLPFTSYDSRLQKGSLWIDENGNRWIANKVKITFSTSSEKIITNVEFVKDFNGISQFTKLDQERRFYEIDQNISNTGYEVYHNYFYFSKTNIGNKQGTTVLTNDLVLDIMNTFKNDLKTIKDRSLYAWVGTYEYEYDNTVKEKAYIPLHVFGAGNTLNFEMGFSHPLNAGNRIITQDSKIVGTTTMYCGKDGFANKIRFVLCRDRVGDFDVPDYPKKANESDGVTLADFYYNYYKKPNEILHLNFSVAFLPYFTERNIGFGLTQKNIEEIYFGERFVCDNLIIPEAEPRTLKIYVSNSHKYTLADRKALGSEVSGSIAVTYNSSSGGRIEITLDDTANNVKSWCICDENENILVAVNQTKSSTSSLILYFIGTNKRL